uniref:arsenate reductase/protein-tyrosine-phosphatase family protein n=1 Tax=Streptomyces polyasparticus TaxID=2767826 RepID=UPI0034D5C6A4
MRILVVCTGNICRSPFAEQLLRHRFPPLGSQRPLAEFSSAGTHSASGQDMSPEAASRLQALGVPVTPHKARQLTSQLLADTDLVLCMAREHRHWVVEHSPGHLRRAFTLREIATLLEHAPDVALPRDPADRLLRLSALAAAARPAVRMRDPRTYEVADPFGRDDRAFDLMSDEIVPAVDSLVSFLTR